MYRVGTIPVRGAAPEDGEAELIAAAQRDPRAFGIFYDRYARQVYRYLRTRVPTDEDAADMTQQVFLRALDALPGYKHGRTPFAAWLFRIARNLAIDVSRRHRPTVTWDVAPDTVTTSAQGVEDAVLRREALRELQRLVSDLDPNKREILALRFMGGLTAREIGAVVDRSEAAVHKQLARTIRHLQEQYHVD